MLREPLLHEVEPAADTVIVKRACARRVFGRAGVEALDLQTAEAAGRFQKDDGMAVQKGVDVYKRQDYTTALGLTGSPWIGLDNFTRFFGGEYAFRLIRNTFMLSLLDLIFNFPAPILFALLLNEIHSRAFRRTIQTISYMPYFVSMVVMCGIIVDFTQSGGLISEAVALITGGRAQNLLGNKDYFRTIYTVSSIWQGLGYGSIIYLAALSGVNQDLYEAARIDGAGRWKQTIHCLLYTSCWMRSRKAACWRLAGSTPISGLSFR